jgi:precorrin-2/cobalt-factor-2 C20-methyltransferase
MSGGTLHIVSMGPGDPELLTLKAARILAATRCCAFFAKRGQPGHAMTVARAHLSPEAETLRFDYPFTTELPPGDAAYRTAMDAFYESSAGAIAARLEAGRDVALPCEGDAFFYGSAMHVFDRLVGRCRIEVIPGVPAMAGAWSRALAPIAHGDDVLGVLPGTLDEDALVARMQGVEAAVVMKVGRNLPKIRAALARAGRLDEALLVERATMTEERILRLADASADRASPYFSLILLPGRKRAR